MNLSQKLKLIHPKKLKELLRQKSKLNANYSECIFFLSYYDKEKYEPYFSSSYFEILMAIITIFILYGDDIRLLDCDPYADTGFYIAF
jgi:hypothetical protein